MAFTLTTDTLAAGYTVTTLIDKLEALLTLAMGPKISRYTVSNSTFIVWELPKAFPTDRPIFVRLEVTNTFGTSLNILGNFVAPSTATSITSWGTRTFGTTSSNLNFTMFHKPGEGFLLHITMNSYSGWLGATNLLDTPEWVDRTAVECVMLTSANTLGFMTPNQLPDFNPYGGGNNVYTAKLVGQVASSVNTFYNRREVLPGVYLSNGVGYLGKFSDDFGGAAISGMSLLDKLEVQAGVEEWTVLEATASGMVIRTL